jgi:hypothetical protein
MIIVNQMKEVDSLLFTLTISDQRTFQSRQLLEEKKTFDQWIFWHGECRKPSFLVLQWSRNLSVHGTSRTFWSTNVLWRLFHILSGKVTTDSSVKKVFDQGKFDKITFWSKDQGKIFYNLSWYVSDKVVINETVLIRKLSIDKPVNQRAFGSTNLLIWRQSPLRKNLSKSSGFVTDSAVEPDLDS